MGLLEIQKSEATKQPTKTLARVGKSGFRIMNWSDVVFGQKTASFFRPNEEDVATATSFLRR